MKAIPSIAEDSNCDVSLLRLILELGIHNFDKNAELHQGENISESEMAIGSMYGSVLSTSADVQKNLFLIPTIWDAMALESHLSKKSPEWLKAVTKACEELQPRIASIFSAATDSNTATPQKKTGIPSVDVLIQLAALINTNAHGMGSNRGVNTDKAMGIFPFVSLVNHSCRSNCIFYSSEDITYVRATQNVAIGEELCVSYIDLYDTRVNRNKTLEETKHFVCDCVRCSEPFDESVDRFIEGVLCNRKGCKGVLMEITLKPNQADAKGHELYLSPWECDTCHRKADLEHVNVSKDGGASYQDRPWEAVARANILQKRGIILYNNNSLTECRIVLEKLHEEFGKVLHPLHVILFDSLVLLMNCARFEGDLAGSIKYCERIVDSMRTVTPTKVLDHARFLFNLSDLYKMRAETVSQSSSRLARRMNEKSKEVLKEANKIEETVYGSIQD